MKKVLFAALAPAAASDSSAAPAQRLRGTVQSFDGSTLVMLERSGATISLALADNFSVTEVVPIALTDIAVGSFIGAAAMPAADGTQNALEVLVFPEAMRGTGEGHSPWDLQPGSTMTNATVAELAARGPQPEAALQGRRKPQPIETYNRADGFLLVPSKRSLIPSWCRAPGTWSPRTCAGAKNAHSRRGMAGEWRRPAELGQPLPRAGVAQPRR